MGAAIGGRRELASSVLVDVRYALRSMSQSKVVTSAALLTLALGIGANTAMFSVVRGVLLKPLDFPDPERIVQVEPGTVFSAEQIDALSEVSGLGSLSALGAQSLVLKTDTDARELRALYVDGDHFDTFGLQPALGRALRDSDSRPGADPVVVLGHSFWQRQFGGELGVIGSTVRLSGDGASERIVVGVLPPEYPVVEWLPDVVIPHRLEPGSHDHADNLRFSAVGRLAPGVTLESAELELRDVAGRHAEQGAKNFDLESARTLELETYREARVGDVGTQLWLLLGVVALVLLITCANVANLLLARSVTRVAEISVRRALGAARDRIVRQLLTESLVLGAIGGVCGITLAWFALPLLVGALPENLPRASEIELDTTVLCFSVLISIVAATVFGLGPALRLARPAAASLRSTRSVGSSGVNRLLVAGQIALSVVLVSCCGLLIRSLEELQSVEAGFVSEDLYALRVSPPVDVYPEEDDLRRYYREVLEAVRASPSVERAGAISSLPLTRARLGVAISPDGQPVPERDAPFYVSYRAVSTDTFRTMQIPLLEGRDLSDQDLAGSTPYGVINNELARRLWPDESAVGRRISWPDGSHWLTVAGVVGDVRDADLASEVAPLVYASYEQESWVRSLYLTARARRGMDPLVEMRSAVKSVDPFVPIESETSMEGVVRRSLATPRFHALFFSWFSILALVLSCVGLYGMTAHQVAQRTSEYGVRMTFGASVLDVLFGVVRDSLWQIGLGVSVGALGVLFVGQWLEGMLHDVSRLDPLVLGSTIVGLSAVAIVVALLGARRAVTLEPLSALRND